MNSFFGRLFGNSSDKEPTSILAEQPKKRPHYCEVCGKVTRGGRYIFLAEASHFVILRSKMVVSCDNDAVVLADGCRVPIDVRNSIFAFGLKDKLIQHYVCSDECISDLCKCPLRLREDLVDTMPAIDLTKLQGGIWWPQPFEVSNIRCDELSCEVCGGKYPDTGSKKFSVGAIESISELHGNLNEAARSGKFDILQNGVKDVSDSGRYWGMNVVKQDPRMGQFCSDGCVFEYCEENQSYITFPNIVLNGFLSFISPIQKEVNSDLENSYCLRPTKMMPLP